MSKISLFGINYDDIKCYEIVDNEKIIKADVKSLLNYENDSDGFVEIKMFGIDQVYSLINFRKLRHFIKMISEINLDLNLFIARVLEDTPMIDNVNFKYNSITVKQLTVIDWIFIYQFKSLIDGMNIMSETKYDIDIFHQLNIGTNIDDMRVMNALEISPDVDETAYSKYIMVFDKGKCKYCNSIYTDSFKGVFVRLEEFNCWQYLTNEQYFNLIKAKSVSIHYAITDKPTAFSKVIYNQEYFSDTLLQILKQSIYIPCDIYLYRIFDTDKSKEVLSLPYFQKTYNALEISVSKKGYTTSIVLTYNELGISDKLYSNDYNGSILYVDKFCLLELINNLIHLKPY